MTSGIVFTSVLMPRIDEMLVEGLVAEVRKAEGKGVPPRVWFRCRDLAIKRSWSIWTENVPYEEAVYKLKRDTRHFAKRQITWFKRERDVIWVDKDAFEYDEEKILQYMLAVLQREDMYWNALKNMYKEFGI